MNPPIQSSIDGSLHQAVDRFARLVSTLPDADLDRAWAWGAYDSEGVRFAFFRVYEELRTLAVHTAQARVEAGHAPSSAQRILAHYHAAYRDLDAVLIGRPSEVIERSPAEGEWSVRQALNHIVEADAGFFAVISHAVDQMRSGVAEPGKLTQEAYAAIVGMDEATENALLEGPIESLMAAHSALHDRILAELATIDEDEIERLSMYWEGYPLSIRFRLHRLDSHMRQHTVQIDKTLVSLGHGPTEAQRLLRLIYAALAEAEGSWIGAVSEEPPMLARTADTVAAVASEIAARLQ